MSNKVIIKKDNRIFEAYVSSTYPNVVEVTFYEVVRPSWKIFRTNFFPFYSTWFALSLFKTIESGIKFSLNKGLEEEAKEKLKMTKWQTFEKTLDKTIEM